MNKYEEVVSSTSGLVYAIINKYFKGYDVDDLYQVGVVGVINAYNNYKVNSNTKFSTYAYKYIYGEIYSYINKQRGIKISKEYISLYKKINDASNVLRQKLMKEPSYYELSLFLGIDEKVITSIYEGMGMIDSLERSMYNSDNRLSLYDTISDDKDYYNIDYLLLNEEIDKLESPYKELIYLRYFEDRTQSDVAKCLGMNQTQVSRGEKRALRKIRNSYQSVC